MVPVDFLRSLTEQFRPGTATIQRYTETVSGDGTTQAWVPLATVSCRVSRVGQSGNESLGGSGGIQAVGQRRIKLPAGTDVTPRDRIVVAGVTYEVADVLHIDNETERTTICREVT